MKRANIGFFAREVLKRPLYPFQETIGNAILNSVLNNLGLTFTVMVSRQSGKNQTSAVIEAYLLSAYEERHYSEMRSYMETSNRK